MEVKNLKAMQSYRYPYALCYCFFHVYVFFTAEYPLTRRQNQKVDQRIDEELSDQTLPNEFIKNKHGKLGENSFGLTKAKFFMLTKPKRDSFESLIPADVADFKKAFFYYTVKYGKGKCCYIMMRNLDILSEEGLVNELKLVFLGLPLR
ncbi:hypothetical protein STEG23_015127 [Scotinomys teguina]